MFKLILTSLLLTAINPTFASSDIEAWKKYVGCYKTLKVNGEDFKTEHLSRVTFDNFSHEWELNQNLIPSVNFNVVVEGSSYGGFGFNQDSVFVNMGETYQKDDELIFKYIGELYSKAWNKNTGVYVKIKLRELAERNIQVEFDVDKSTYRNGHVKNFLVEMVKVSCS